VRRGLTFSASHALVFRLDRPRPSSALGMGGSHAQIQGGRPARRVHLPVPFWLLVLHQIHQRACSGSGIHDGQASMAVIRAWNEARGALVPRSTRRRSRAPRAQPRAIRSRPRRSLHRAVSMPLVDHLHVVVRHRRRVRDARARSVWRRGFRTGFSACRDSAVPPASGTDARAPLAAGRRPCRTKVEPGLDALSPRDGGIGKVGVCHVDHHVPAAE